MVALCCALSSDEAWLVAINYSNVRNINYPHFQNNTTHLSPIRQHQSQANNLNKVDSNSTKYMLNITVQVHKSRWQPTVLMEFDNPSCRVNSVVHAKSVGTIKMELNWIGAYLLLCPYDITTYNIMFNDLMIWTLPCNFSVHFKHSTLQEHVKSLLPRDAIRRSRTGSILADGIKPLPAPLLKCYQPGQLQITWGQFYKRYRNHQLLKLSWN